jgi:hypothetical protein
MRIARSAKLKRVRGMFWPEEARFEANTACFSAKFWIINKQSIFNPASFVYLNIY